MYVIRSISLLFALTLIFAACGKSVPSPTPESRQLDLEKLWDGKASPPNGYTLLIQCQIRINPLQFSHLAVFSKTDSHPTIMPASTEAIGSKGTHYLGALMIFQRPYGIPTKSHIDFTDLVSADGKRKLAFSTGGEEIKNLEFTFVREPDSDAYIVTNSLQYEFKDGDLAQCKPQ